MQMPREKAEKQTGEDSYSVAVCIVLRSLCPGRPNSVAPETSIIHTLIALNALIAALLTLIAALLALIAALANRLHIVIHLRLELNVLSGHQLGIADELMPSAATHRVPFEVTTT